MQYNIITANANVRLMNKNIERKTEMNEIIINNTSLGIKEYNGQRVVTLKDIDSVHKRLEGTARKRFNDNKKTFY